MTKDHCQSCGALIGQDPDAITAHRNWHYRLAYASECPVCEAPAYKDCTYKGNSTYMHDARMTFTTGN